MTKAQIVQSLAETVGVPKAQAAALLDELVALAAREVRDSGEFTIPGVVKFVVAQRAARKARDGVNPFTNQPMRIAAKPATRVVKARVASAFAEEALAKKKRGR